MGELNLLVAIVIVGFIVIVIIELIYYLLCLVFELVMRLLGREIVYTVPRRGIRQGEGLGNLKKSICKIRK